MNPSKPEDSLDRSPDDEQKQDATPLAEGGAKQDVAEELPASDDDTKTQSPVDITVPSETDVEPGGDMTVDTETKTAPPMAETEPVPDIPKAEDTQPLGRTNETNIDSENNDKGAVMPSMTAASTLASAPRKRRKKLLTATVLIVVGLLLIAGGAAAAYFGVVVPNKPENVLKDATLNSLKANGGTTFDGNFAINSSENSSFPAVKGDFVTQAGDNSSNTTIKMVISGVDLSLDARTIDGNLYVKVGDLTTAKSLITASFGTFTSSPAEAALLGALFDQASALVSEQWIVFDSTLLSDNSMGCLVETASFTNDDLRLLEEQFKKNPFAAIDSHADEVVEGVQTTKYNLTIDNQKGSAYINGLDELSAVRALEACGKAVEQYDIEAKPNELLGDGTTKMSVWVDKSEKRIHKLAVEEMALDDESQATLNIETLVNYGGFSVEKPENARPALQVWSEIQSLLFTGLGQFEF